MQSRAFPSVAEALAFPSDRQASNCWAGFDLNERAPVSDFTDGTTTGWTLPASPSTWQIVDDSEAGKKVLEITGNNSSPGFSSVVFPVGSGEAYEFSFGLQCMTDSLGSSYGLYLGLTSGQSFEWYTFSGGGWGLAGTTTNAYFVNNYRNTAKTYYKTWICGSSVDVNLFPAPGGSSTVYLLKLVDTGTCRIRTGWNSYSGVRTFHIITPSIRKILAYQEVAPGAKITKPTAPTRNGYTTDNIWYTDASLTTAWDFNQTVSSDNITLYTKWVPITYTLTYNRNGGSGDNNPATYTIESSAITLAAPSRTGYTFGGWYDNSSFTGSAVTTVPTGSMGNKTFYAKWTANTYTVAYNSNSGTGTTASSSHTYDTAKALTANAFTRTGYTFAGWATTASGAVAYTDKQSVTNLSSTQGATVTLYAVWEAITYTITCVLNGGTDPGIDATYTIESPPVPLYPSTRRGYTFQGWYDNAAFSGSPITSIPTGSYGDRTYYAKWQVIVYTITYTLNGGTQNPANPTTYTVESADIVFSAPARRGYVFTGWYDNSSFVGSPDTGIPHDSIGNRVYYARWNLIVYRITYELSGGANNPGNPPEYTVESSTIPLQEAERRGYIYEGWYDNPDFSGDPVTSIPHSSIGDRTLYAKWQVIVYPVEYVLSGGEQNPDNPESYTVESPDIPLLNPERPGYSFAGWFDNAGFIDAPITHIPAASIGALKFFARWTRGVTFPTGREKWDRYGGDPMILL